MKIAYCGYDFFHTGLAALLADGHELVELFTYPTDNCYNFNDHVSRLAAEAKARITLSRMTPGDIDRLDVAGVEAIVCAAYPYKVPEWRGGSVRYALNVHPTALPEGRGVWPLPWTILKDLTETAVTIHEISDAWDEGDIVAQVRLPVSNRETLESLSLRSQLATEPLLRGTLRDIETLWPARRPQGPGGSTWPMPREVDRTIDWTMDIATIDRIVRAFSKFEAFVYLDGVRHYVRKVDVWPADHGFTPGAPVHRANREIVFAARDGFVCLSHYVRADDG